MGYLRVQRDWYEQAAKNMPCALYQVETNVVVPVRLASDRDEFGARTIRPRIGVHATKLLVPVKRVRLEHDSRRVSLNPEIEEKLQQLMHMALDDEESRQSAQDALP